MKELYPFRYMRVMRQRALGPDGRKREAEQPMRKKLTQGMWRGILAVGVIVLGAGVYDHIAHANGHDGLTQGFVWGAVQNGECVDVGFIATHKVEPEESVTLRVQSVMSGFLQEEIIFDISGNPLEAGGHQFCFDSEEFQQAEIIFHATNDGLTGAPESYVISTP
jgi:hypothetical protein